MKIEDSKKDSKERSEDNNVNPIRSVIICLGDFLSSTTKETFQQPKTKDSSTALNPS
jgi:hypothetical protein